MTDEHQRKRQLIFVRGVVQGVGFRPFVYRLATDAGLTGSVGNNTDGVTIAVEGPEDRLSGFLARLRTEAPPMARIDDVDVKDAQWVGDIDFRIITSQVLGQVSTGIPADAATCDDCVRELFDPADRRYRYAFLNCTNCGPRFTITRRIPYDRPQTSMAEFPMCPACQAEYDNPLNRRFHAQPNACWQCGPRLWLVAADASPIETDDPVTACVDRLMAGEIVAIKGIGGFHLSVDAANEQAVNRLRERKRRYGKPLAVMARDLRSARLLSSLTAEEEALLLGPARPIVLVQALGDNGIAPSVAPGIPWLGLFLPCAPLQHLLLADSRVRALVMTSANISEEPIAIENEEALERLKGIADVFLMHNRKILQRCDDSVVAAVDQGTQIVRRARGFVPLSVDLPQNTRPVLAVGGHLKSVFALAQGRKAYQSQHLGDFENLTVQLFFEESLAHLMRTFEVAPEVVVHDLHPGYLSTSWAKQWARERGLPIIGVQHHHAHIAACMAEHHITGPVIGLSLDGTGYGTDGRIWGGEVLIARYESFERFAHLEYVAMPGGDAAVRAPWRMALAHLNAAGFDIADSGFLHRIGIDVPNPRLLLRMIQRNINSPLTSSLGRLFDAAAAIILGRREVDYEAQAAIELEGICVDEGDSTDGYTIDIEKGDWNRRIPSRILVGGLWKQLLRDVQQGVAKSTTAARFHAGIATALVCAARQARVHSRIEIVAMSGGVMHNRRLTRLLRTALEIEGFRVIQQRRVSPGDGGLSYGQAAVASALLARP